MRLKETAHLRVAGSGAVENQEVDLEAGSVHQEGKDDEARYPGCPVFDVRSLRISPISQMDTHNRHGEVTELLPKILNRV